VVQPGDRVGDRQHRVHLVGDEDDREVQVVAKFPEQLDDGARRGGVESGRRLVGEQHRRPQGQRACDADPLPLTTGELEGVVPGPFGKADPVEQFGDAALGFRCGDAQIFEGKGHVFGRGTPLQQTRRLEDGADAPARHPQPSCRQRREVLTVDDDRSGRRCGQQVDALRERALARPARSDHREDLASIDAEGDVVEHQRTLVAATVCLGQVRQFDHVDVTIAEHVAVEQLSDHREARATEPAQACLVCLSNEPTE
jgi:hypothetical protein